MPAQTVTTFRSPTFQHAVAFDLRGIKHTASDNHFDLYPNEVRHITVDFDRPASRAQVAVSLHHHSLAATYV